MFDAKLKGVNLIFLDLKKISNLQTQIATLATKAELQVEQDKIGKLQTYDSSLFIGQSAKVSLAMMIR